MMIISDHFKKVLSFFFLSLVPFLSSFFSGSLPFLLLSSSSSFSCSLYLVDDRINGLQEEEENDPLLPINSSHTQKEAIERGRKREEEGEKGGKKEDGKK